jgi:hypothetical protein
MAEGEVSSKQQREPLAVKVNSEWDGVCTNGNDSDFMMELCKNKRGKHFSLAIS